MNCFEFDKYGYDKLDIRHNIQYLFQKNILSKYYFTRDYFCKLFDQWLHIQILKQ